MPKQKVAEIALPLIDLTHTLIIIRDVAERHAKELGIVNNDI